MNLNFNQLETLVSCEPGFCYMMLYILAEHSKAQLLHVFVKELHIRCPGGNAATQNVHKANILQTKLPEGTNKDQCEY